MLAAGCPRSLDYSKRDEPFWALKEALVHYVITEDRGAEFYKVSAQQKSSLQGFPGPGAVHELTEYLRAEAIDGVQAFGRCLLPWLKWSTPEEVEANKKTQLKSGAQDLIKAWIREFDPENVEAYSRTLEDLG